MPIHALTHAPSPHMQACLRTFVPTDPIDLERACEQHAAYCRALQQCGAAVDLLEVNAASPDAVFIEDTAVVLDEVAVLAAPGASSRRVEIAAMEGVLLQHRPIDRIVRGTLEGGDVLQLGRTLLVGQSCRTSAAGIESLADIVARFGYRVVAVPVERCLHLKTGCSALPDGRLLVNSAWIPAAALADYDTVPIPESEPWGANVLSLGGSVLLPTAHARTAALLEQSGFAVVGLELSEFAKAEGGATCLALLRHS